MKAKRCVLATVIVILTMVISFVTVSQPQAKTINLTFNIPGPAQHPASAKPAQYFAKEIEKRTQGRIKITLFFGSTLASPTETFDATIKGICDIGESLCGWIAGRFPVTEVCDLPLGYTSAWVEAHVFTDFYNKFKPKEWNEVVPLFFAATPPASVGTSKEPVRKFEDMRGLTLRSSAMTVELLKFMGAVPRVMPINEVYEALSKNVVDGSFITTESYVPFKLAEVLKYCTDTRFISTGMVIFHVMNKDTWNEISPVDQKTIMAVGLETMDMKGKMFDKGAAYGLKVFSKMKGREVITLPEAEKEKFRVAVKTIIDDWVKKRTAQGYPAAEYVKYIRERIVYWDAKKPK